MTRLASIASLLVVLGACGGDDNAAEDTDGSSAEESTGSTGVGSSDSNETSASTTGPGSTDPTTGPGETTDATETTGETGEEPPCEGIGFDAEASVWALPDLSALPLEVSDPMQLVGDNWGCTNEEQLRYTTMDLTGDGQLDVVLTDGCDANGVGTERWIVHPGEDGGFGAATTWTLPDLSALPLDVSDPMQLIADNWGCTNEEQLRYTLMELTGDGRVDFVITDGCDANGVGTERWIVHPGEDGGFGAATTWTLPDLSALPLDVSDPMQLIADNWGCTNEEQLRYTLMELTGDGRVDFVITDGCDANGVGTERWIVHPGEDGGFGAAATWTLPDLSALPLEVSDPMQLVGDNWGCTNEEQLRYSTMDLDGDGLLDIVLTDGCDADGVGTERWISHPAVCE